MGRPDAARPASVALIGAWLRRAPHAQFRPMQAMFISMFAKLETVLRKIRRHGFGATAYEAAVKALGALVDFKILRGVFVDRPDPAFLDCPYRPMLLDAAALRRFAADPANELSQEFLCEAGARGDQCYAICDGERLAAYGWYAFGPTPIGLPGLLLRFRPGYVYMYKGFTHDDYRGQRLHAIGMTHALRHYLGGGYRGIVSYVESTNFDSLKSCFRMGYKAFGTIVVLKAFGRYHAAATPGCAAYEFRVEPSNGDPGLIFGKER
jgi:hypothetical protein